MLALETLKSLGSTGADVTLVSPCRASSLGSVSDRVSRLCEAVLAPVRWPALRNLQALTWSLFKKEPWTLAKHRSPAVQRKVSELLSRRAFDVVHVEQLQSLSHLAGAREEKLAVVLRAHNVESDLWRQTASFSGPFLGLVLRREAERLARNEGRALRDVDAVVALTSEDEKRLRQLSGPTAILERIAAPFVAELPAASYPLAGKPAVVLFGSTGWRPNVDAQRWFLQEVWPRALQRLPDGHLHLFGGHSDVPIAGVSVHSRPVESIEAFAPNSTLVVPLRIASGVRIKILEAWSRGIPVVASPEACGGLESSAVPALWCAKSPADYVEGLVAMEEAEIRAQTTAQGREILRRWHRPEEVAAELLELYSRVRDRAAS